MEAAALLFRVEYDFKWVACYAEDRFPALALLGSRALAFSCLHLTSLLCPRHAASCRACLPPACMAEACRLVPLVQHHAGWRDAH